MYKYVFVILLLFFLFSGCAKQTVNHVKETEVENNITDKDIDFSNFEDAPPFGIYDGMEDVLTPDEKVLRVYIAEIIETSWGPLHSPVVYLYDRENRVLAKYSTFELISEEFWPGYIRVSYNNDRNSFDMIFSLDAYGNYGTGYIDLNTSKYVRELLALPPKDEQSGMEVQQQ